MAVKKVRAIVLPLKTENSHNEDMLLLVRAAVDSYLPRQSPYDAEGLSSTSRDVYFMIDHAEIMDVEIDEFNLVYRKGEVGNAKEER